MDPFTIAIVAIAGLALLALGGLLWALAATDTNYMLRVEAKQAQSEAARWKDLHDRAHHGWARANNLNRQMLPEPYRFGLGLVRDLQRVAEDEEAN